MKIHFKSLIESLPNLDCLVKADFSALTLHMRASYVISVCWKDLRTSDHCRIGEAERLSCGYLATSYCHAQNLLVLGSGDVDLLQVSQSPQRSVLTERTVTAVSEIAEPQSYLNPGEFACCFFLTVLLARLLILPGDFTSSTKM